MSVVSPDAGSNGSVRELSWDLTNGTARRMVMASVTLRSLCRIKTTQVNPRDRRTARTDDYRCRYPGIAQ